MISEFDVEELVRGMFELDDDVDAIDFLGNYYGGGVEWETYVQIIEELIVLYLALN